jgi:hypothetical protein
MAKRVFVVWALSVLGLGCSGESSSSEPERAATRNAASEIEPVRSSLAMTSFACAGYQQYGAALATFTLDCLGTIAPTSYRITAGKLERSFDTCPVDSSKLRDIDAVLSLQHREAQAPGLSQCLSRRYVQFLADFSDEGVSMCPSWRKLQTVNPISHALIESTSLELERAFAHPAEPFSMPDVLEEKNLWAVSFEGAQRSASLSPGAAASACAGGFDGFVLGHEAGSVLTDPPSWLAPWTFATAADDPFLKPGFYHPMSFYGPPPGAVFAHYNRFAPCPGCPAEACSYFAGVHRKTRLQADCLDPADISTCVAYCGPPLP